MRSLPALLAVLIACANAPPVSAQPLRTATGASDLSGMWGGTLSLQSFSFEFEDRIAARLEASRKQPPAPGSLESMYKPNLLTKVRQSQDKDDPTLRCIPYGTPREMLGSVGAHPMEIVQTPKEVVFLYEYFHAYRVVPTDGRPHSEDVFPSYFGDSVGRWDGDTLVVDVTTFNDKTWLVGPGTFHSDTLHVVERYRRVDGSTLEYQATIEDPKVLTGPWTSPKKILKLSPPGTQLVEAMCLDTTSARLMEAAQRKPQQGSKSAVTPNAK